MVRLFELLRCLNSAVSDRGVLRKSFPPALMRNLGTKEVVRLTRLLIMIHPSVSCDAVATCCEISGINIDPTGRSSATKCSYRRNEKEEKWGE